VVDEVVEQIGAYADLFLRGAYFLFLSGSSSGNSGPSSAIGCRQRGVRTGFDTGCRHDGGGQIPRRRPAHFTGQASR
jgi:hypothetical protein